MSIEMITLLLFLALVLFLALGLPLAFVLGGVGVVGCYFLWGSKGLYVAVAQTYGAMGKFTLSGDSPFHLHGHALGAGRCGR